MTKLNESQCVWISIFGDELGRLLKGPTAEDCLSRQVVNVLLQVDRYMAQYPNPREAAKKMRYSCIIDYGRDEGRQRGEGSRHGRKVDQFPTRFSEDTGIQAIEIEDTLAISPEVQAVNRDLCRREMSKVKPVVAMGIQLTAVDGFTQAEAAKILGVTRTYISRAMKQSEREMKRANNSAA